MGSEFGKGKITSKDRVGFHDPLLKDDSPEHTVGCRHTNPDICGNNALDGVCAFVREDGICVRPPKSWPRQYLKLLSKQEGDCDV